MEPGTVTPAPLFRTTRVATGCADEDGRLVLAGGWLMAVPVRLQDVAHGGPVGSWYLKAGFGPCSDTRSPVLDTLDAARAWIERRIAP